MAEERDNPTTARAEQRRVATAKITTPHLVACARAGVNLEVAVPTLRAGVKRKPMPDSVSVIVPAFREAPNIEPLARRVFAALEGVGGPVELIVVDDNSQDGTVEIVEELAKTLPVRVLVRTEERGLASAVLHGFENAKYDVLVVMDADLQHPPESIPDLIEPIIRGAAEMTVGSRYVRGGRIDGEWSWLRACNSWFATLLARPLVSLRDPMSGFAAIRRDVLQRAANLNPVGYKIVLELAVKTGCRRPTEIPIAFAQRQAGESKLSLSEQLRYLNHLVRLYWFRFRWIIVAIVAVGALLAMMWR